MKTVDANYILRYLLGDVPEQYKTAKIAFENDRILIPTEVMAETIYVLIGVYEVPKERVSDLSSDLLDYPNVTTADKKVMNSALEIFKSANIDFIDAILAASALVHGDEILTFEKKLQRMIDSFR